MNRARSIADGFWPGQVSLVLPVKRAILPEELLGRDHTLAVRVPNHECCVRLITSCGNSLVGTSANVSGTSPFVDPDDPLLLEFARKADYFVKGICGKSRLPSTILDLSRRDRISIIREGAVSEQKHIPLLSQSKQNRFFFQRNQEVIFGEPPW